MQIQSDMPCLAEAFLAAKSKGINVDVAVLSDKKTFELSRFALTDELTQVGTFKIPTLRDIELASRSRVCFANEFVRAPFC